MTDARIPVAQGVQMFDAAQVTQTDGDIAYQQRVQVLGGFLIPAYDYVSFSYTGSDITGVTYKSGGSSGTTVASLTLAYSGSNITSVTRTA